MWEQLADDFTHEPTLFPYTACVLARRVQSGYAAAAVFENRIVCYIALAPIVHSGGCAPAWETLTAGLHLDTSILPESNVYTSTSSWTAPEWRGRGINQSIRQPLFSRFLATPHLGVSGMGGLASPLLAKIGWRIIGWDQVPYIGCLVGIPASEFPAQSAKLWRPPHEMLQYQGPHIGLESTDHPWEKYIYLWVSDVKIAEELNRQIETLFGGDLTRWRSVIVDVYAEPNTMWMVAFLNC